MHRDAIPRGAKVLMVDDLLATGGTMCAACELIRKVGAQVVGIAFVIELTDLHGRDKAGPAQNSHADLVLILRLKTAAFASGFEKVLDPAPLLFALGPKSIIELAERPIGEPLSSGVPAEPVQRFLIPFYRTP